MANTKIRGITIELNADTAGILDGIKDLNSSLSSTDKALKDVNKLLKFDSNNTTLLAQQQEYLNQAIEKTEEKLKKEKELLEQLRTADNADQTKEQQNALAREIEATTQKLNQYKGQLDQTDTALSDVTSKTKEASDSSMTFGDVLKANVVSDIVINGIRKLADGIKEVATSAMEAGTSFEASMSQVAATMGITTSEIRSGSEAYNMLSEAARQCGATTQFTASQAAEALNYLALAGYDAEKAAETLPKVLTLAAAGGMDLAYASDLITDSMSAMGMSTAELDNYMDEMTRTAQKANTSVAQLGEATLVCAGTVTLTGQSLETMNTELGILANNGIKGAEGGTHLRNILLSLSAPTDKAAASLKNLGVKVSDSKGNVRDLNDIMTDLSAALDGMGTTEKASVIKSIFNKTDIAAVNALMKGTTGEFAALKAEIENCSGAAKDMADTMMDNLQGKITILKSALEGLGVTFYDIFDDDAKTAVTAATEAVDELQDAMKNGELGKSLEELSEAFGELMQDVIDFTMDALPGIIDGATWFLNNLDTITSLIKGLVAGYAAYEVAAIAATIATEGLTAALALDPLYAAVAAIAGLSVLFVSFGKDADEAAGAIQKSIGKNRDSLDQIKKSYSDNIGNVKELADRIRELNNIENLSADQQVELAACVEQWNTAVDSNNQLILDNTGHIIDNTGALDDNIEAAYRRYELAQKEEELSEITENYAKAKDTLREAEERLEESTRQYYEYLSTEAVESAYLWKQQMEADTEEVNEAKRACDENAQAYERLHDEINEATDALQSHDEAQGEAIGTAEELANSIEDITEELEKEQEALEKTVEVQVASFEKIKEASAVLKDDVLANLESNVEALENWVENMNTLVERGIDDGLLQYLANMGPAGAAQAEQFVDMTGDELSEAGEKWREAISAEKYLNSLVEEYMTAGTHISQEYIDGMWQPINDGSEEEVASALVNKLAENPAWDRIPETAKNAIILANQRMAEAIDEGEDPGEIYANKFVDSEVWEEMPENIKAHFLTMNEEIREFIEDDEDGNVGEDLVNNIIDSAGEAFEERKEEVGEFTKSGLTEPVKETINEEFQTSEGGPSQTAHDYGMNFVTSLAQGITDTTAPTLLPAVRTMAESALTEIQNYLGWNGGYYQKWWEVGMNVDTSIATGITDNQDVIANALQTAMDNAVSSLDIENVGGGVVNKILGAMFG